jgi:hypothetical protein
MLWHFNRALEITKSQVTSRRWKDLPIHWSNDSTNDSRLGSLTCPLLLEEGLPSQTISKHVLHANGYLYSNSFPVTGQPLPIMLQSGRLLGLTTPHRNLPLTWSFLSNSLSSVPAPVSENLVSGVLVLLL